MAGSNLSDRSKQPSGLQEQARPIRIQARRSRKSAEEDHWNQLTRLRDGSLRRGPNQRRILCENTRGVTRLGSLPLGHSLVQNVVADLHLQQPLLYVEADDV